MRVQVKITDSAGKTERVQAFEGLCIAVKRRGIGSSFTVRKISHGEGVERVFPLYSPRVEGVEIVRRGVVRRAKLYYMRKLTGKAARIKEKRDISNDNAGSAEAKEKAAAKKASKAEKKAAKAEKKAAPKAEKKARKPKKKAEKK